MCIQYVQQTYILIYTLWYILHTHIHTYVDQSHINAFALILIGIIYTSPRPGSRKRGLARSLLAEASMAPRRFVHGNTAETAKGVCWRGEYLFVAWDSLSFVAFAFSHTLGKAVVRSPGLSFAWLIIQIQFACCWLVCSFGRC